MSNGFDSYVQEAQRLHSGGDIDGALEMFKSALTEDPPNEEIRREVINLTLKKGDYQQTIVEYFDWAEACQENGAIDDAIRIYQEILGLDTLLQKKMYMMEQEVAEEALAQVQETIQAASGAIFFNLGYLYLEKGALDEAIGCLQKSLEFNPSDAKTHTLLGQVYMQKGQDKEANGEFQEVVRLSPEEAAYAYEMLGELYIRGGKPPQSTILWFRNAGDLYYRHQQFEEAVRAYERILTFEPRNKEILTRIGEVYAQQGYHERASEIYNNLAEVYTDEGLLDKVIGLYEKMVEWDPNNAEAREKVIEIYRRILTTDPSNLTARSKLIGNILRKGVAEEAIPEFLALAQTYLEKGMRKEAKAVCKKLLELDSRSAPAHEIIADIFFDENEREKALEAYLKSVRLYKERGDEFRAAQINEKLVGKFPGTAEVSLQLAKSYHEQGDFDRALLEYQKILNKNPQDVEILTHMMDIFRQNQDEENVIAFAQRILELDPSKTELQDLILEIFEKRQDFNELESIYHRILSSEPGRNDIRHKLIELYQNQGSQDKVIEIYRQLLTLEPDRTDIRQKMIEHYASEGRINEVLSESSALADILLKSNDFEKAEDLYKNVLAFLPGDVTIRERLCNIFRQRGEEEKVQEELLILAGISAKSGNPEDSVRRCMDLLQFSPGDINLKAKIARLSAKAGQIETAVGYFREIAEVYLEKNLTEQAKDVIGQILEIDRGNSDYRLKLIEILKNQMNIDEAINHYLVLLENFLESGQNQDAVYHSRESISLNPMDLDFRKKIVELFRKFGDVQNARFFADELVDLYLNRSEYDEVISLYDGMSDTYRLEGDSGAFYDMRENIAQIFERQAKFHDAILEYLYIIESNLMESEILKARRLFPVVTDLYFKEKRPGEAVESLEDIAEKLCRVNRLREAIAVLEQIVEIHERMEKPEQCLNAYRKMIQLYRDLSEGDNVVETYQERIQILKSLGRTEEAIDEMFEIIRYYLDTVQLDFAMEQFQKVQEADEESAVNIFKMARILFEYEMFDQSRPLYEKVLEKEPDNYDALAKVAIILAKSGNLQDAVSHTRKIFSKGLVAEVIEEYKKSSEEDLEESQIHINLGLFYQEMGFIEEAILEYQQAASDPARLLDAYNRMAICFRQEGMTELAVRQFERALEQTGYPEEEYLPIRYNLGETLLENGQIQEALAAFYECYMVDINYRDISEKIAALNEQLQAAESA